jgi:hypothetical protein
VGAGCTAKTTPDTVPASATPVRPAVTATGNRRVPRLHHLWLFVFENHSYDSIIGNPAAPYLNSLAARHGIATQMFAITHPSLPNYLAMIGGSTFECTSDDCPPTLPSPTLAGQIAAKGLSWAAYPEGLPGVGYTGGDTEAYDQHHDPFTYFTEIRDSPAMRRSIRPLTEFDGDLRHAPALTFVVGNDEDNMHFGDVAAGDAFGRHYVGAALSSPAFRDHGAVFITWDESFSDDHRGCCGPAIAGGRVPLIVVTSDGPRRVRSAIPHDTYSILRTIEDGLGLPRLGHAGDPSTAPLAEFWG